MRYLIIRRNTRILLLVTLLAAVFISALPWAYKKAFIFEDNFVERDTVYYLREAQDFPAYIFGQVINRNISLDSTFLKDNYLLSRLEVRELGLGAFKVSGNIFIKGRFLKDDVGSFKGFTGKLFSRDITLNSNKFMTASMSFRIIDDELEIGSLRLGKSYVLQGTVALRQPFRTRLRLEIMRADIRDLARLIRVKNPDVVHGMMSGVFQINGPIAKLFSSGSLQSRNGKIGPIEYNVVTVRTEGFGPVINIVDSSLRQGDGLLTVKGYIDLRDIGKGNLFGGMRVKSDMKTIVWDGWDINKYGVDRLSMSKDIGDKMRVGFKTMTRAPLTTYYERENPEEMSLEYKMGTENLKMKLKENEEFFGIEHSIKF